MLYDLKVLCVACVAEYVVYVPAFCAAFNNPANGILRKSIGALKSTDTSSSNIGWGSHKAVESIPDSLVKTIEGNDSMRRKFEALCRNAQVLSL